MVQQRLHIFRRHVKKISEPEIWIFTKREIALIIIFTIIGTFISFIPLIPTNLIKILTFILIFIIIIITNLSIKKLIAPYYAIKIEHKDWELIRWGYYERSHFKKPFPIGLTFPFFMAILTLGYLKPFIFFQFDAENIPQKRLLKAHGQRRAVRKEVISEEDLAYTSAAGFYALLLLALVGLILKPYFPEFGFNLSKYSIYFGFWNLLPFSQLDGSKLFFGAPIAWVFITLLYLIALLIMIF